MKKLSLISIGFISLLTISAPALAEKTISAWPDFDNYTSVFKNPGQPGLDYIFTQTKHIPAGDKKLPLSPLKVTTGKGVDTLGALLRYRIYTQCFVTVSNRADGYHGGITLKAGHRFYTEEEQEKYGKTASADIKKTVTNNTPPYKYELSSNFFDGSLSPSYFLRDPLISLDRLKNDCMTNATASPINPGYCRITTISWEAAFEVIDDYDVLRLVCERSSVIAYESDKAKFEVSPELVKKTYSISNQEANALLAGAGVKLTKARK